MVHEVHLLDPGFHPSLVPKDALHVDASFLRSENIHGFHDQLFFTVLDEVRIGFTHSVSPLMEALCLSWLDQGKRLLQVLILTNSRSSHYPNLLRHRVALQSPRLLGQLLVKDHVLPVVAHGVLQPNHELLPGAEFRASSLRQIMVMVMMIAGRVVMVMVVFIRVRVMGRMIGTMLAHGVYSSLFQSRRDQ
jgi:hypothetical protein